MAFKSERGAVVVQVAVSLLALLALSSFVIDHGVMMTARGQAQNAADAGALAGAQSLMLNQGDDHAEEVAYAVAQRHGIFAEDVVAGNVTVTVPLPCPPPWNTPSGCIKVDISRQDLPTFFAKLVNIQSQGVKATATAMAGAGNSVECIKPWVVADKWIDNSVGADAGMGPGWDQMDTFDPAVDTYAAPGFKAEGTPNDFGTQLVLKDGNTGEYSSGWTMQIEFGVPGSSAYEDTITGCPSYVPTVGFYDGEVPCATRGDEPNPEKGCLDVKPGMAQGPTRRGVNTIVARDSTATFNPSTNEIDGGCMAAEPPTCDLSPRIVPVALFNTAAYVAMDAAGACSGGNCVAQVVNIMGFFVEGMCDDVYPNPATRPAYCGTNAQAGKSVVGRIINYPAQASAVAGAPGPASFLQTTILVR